MCLIWGTKGKIEYLQYGEQSSPGIPFFFFLFLSIHAYLFREYLQCGEQSSPGFPLFFFFYYIYQGIPTMWRTVITWYPIFFLSFFFFLTIQAYLFRESLQCGEQSSPGFPFFFIFFLVYISGNTYNVANSHHLVSQFFFFFFFFLTIQANLFRESLQCGEQSSHGFPFFFFFFLFIYLGNTCNVANMTWFFLYLHGKQYLGIHKI